MADDLGDDPLRLSSLPSEIRDPCHHLMAGYRPHVFALRDKNILIQLLVVRQHKPIAFVLLVIPDNCLIGPIQDLKYRPFRPFSLCPRFLRNDLDPVPVHGAAGPLRRNEDILLLAFHGDESKSSGMACENAYSGKLLRPAVLSLFGNTDLPLLQKDVQNLFKLLPPALGDVQKNGQFFQLHGNV